MKRQIFTNERRRAVKRSLKMKFRVDVTRVVPLLPRKGVDSSTCGYYTRVFLNLGPSLPPRTLCKYSNGTANGAPLFDSLKTARSKEIGSRKLRLKFYLLLSTSPRESHESVASLSQPRSFVVVVDFTSVYLRICTKSVGGQFLPTLNYIVRPQDLYGHSIHDLLLFFFVATVFNSVSTKRF